jgi:hypothetical protein
MGRQRGIEDPFHLAGQHGQHQGGREKDEFSCFHSRHYNVGNGGRQAGETRPERLFLARVGHFQAKKSVRTYATFGLFVSLAPNLN